MGVFDMERKMNKEKNETLTTVSIDQQLYRSAKIRFIETGMSFKQFVFLHLHEFVSSSADSNISGSI
jgi:hypothetical protein